MSGMANGEPDFLKFLSSNPLPQLTKKEADLYKEVLRWKTSPNDLLPINRRAPVAQLDRVLDYESRGYWFKSSRAHHFLTLPIYLFENPAQDHDCHVLNAGRMVRGYSEFFFLFSL